MLTGTITTSDTGWHAATVAASSRQFLSRAPWTHWELLWRTQRLMCCDGDERPVLVVDDTAVPVVAGPRLDGDVRPVRGVCARCGSVSIPDVVIHPITEHEAARLHLLADRRGARQPAI